MKTNAECHSDMLVILEDARAMQTIGGARMIRRTGKALAQAVARLLHVQPVGVEQTRLG